jgi:hypothetical protein
MYYSQLDERWKNKKLGFGKTTFGSSGCPIVSIANLHKFYSDSKLTPLEINEIAKKCGAFNVDMLNFSILAKELGYNYEKWTPSHPLFKKLGQRVIAETNYYSKVGVPQHFFFYNPATNKRIDPLDKIPSWEDNSYPLVSYRIFTKIAPLVIKKVEKVQSATIDVKTLSAVKIEPITTPQELNTAIDMVNNSPGITETEKTVILDTIKLSELPKIEEITALGEFKKLLMDLFNFIFKK